MATPPLGPERWRIRILRREPESGFLEKKIDEKCETVKHEVGSRTRERERIVFDSLVPELNLKTHHRWTIRIETLQLSFSSFGGTS